MMPLQAQQPQRVNLMMAQLMNAPVLTQPGIRTPMPFPAETFVGETFTPSETGAQAPVKDGTGGTQQGQTLTRSQAFTPMTESDLSNFLSQLKLPVTKENLATAKGMLESGLPLTSENFRDLNDALAQLPKRLPTDFQAASFLKLSSLPLTTHNMTVLSNFITSHPLIGAQLFEVQFEFRKFVGGSTKVPRELMEMLSTVPGLLGEYILDGKNGTRKKNQQSFHKMAQQVGIEKMGPGWWQDDEMDLMKMLIALRSRLSGKGMEEEESIIQRLIQLLGQTEENIAAQQLINRGKRQDEAGFYYMQVPMRLDEKETTAEVRFYYTTDYHESKKIDEDNTIIEFTVTSEHMGQLYFHVEINHGIISVDVGTRDEEVRVFVEKYLPALMENVKKLAYTPAQAKSYVMAEPACVPQLIEVKEFETLERVDLQY